MSISRCANQIVLALAVVSMIPTQAGSTPEQPAIKQLNSATLELLDPLAVNLHRPEDAVKSFHLPENIAVVDCDILIVGGGTGGVAAALSACRQGLSVVLTEETDWLGGQMTSQGVSALDENYLVETSGANFSYQVLRTAIRDYYNHQYKLTNQSESTPYLNPGCCWVSRLSFEPQVAVDTIKQMLAPLLMDGWLKVHYRHKIAGVKLKRNKLDLVQMVNLDNGQAIAFRPRICLDTTELGDLVALSGAPYVVGAESQAQTGEPHAPENADPDNVQDYVFPFVLKYIPGENHTIEKPPYYDEFDSRGKFSLNGYRMFAENSLVNGDGNMQQLLPFWTYRRLIDKTLFADSAFDSDLSMINWDSNDLRGENIIDKSPAQAALRLARAKALSLGFLYWLQTAAPRDEGGTGYPELQLQTNLLGTKDGLSKYPYIRESRRILSKQRILEQQIAAATNKGARAQLFQDSIGIGLYPIDIHGHEEIPGAGQESRPFQIPLSALIPKTPHNLLAAAKNIGTTHITNGSYRLHPIEWSIGEAAGLMAQFSLQHRVGLRQIGSKRKYLRKLQNELLQHGIPIYWYDDVSTQDANFAAIQFLSLTGIMSGAQDDLHFRPHDAITRAEAAHALYKLLQLRLSPIARKTANTNSDGNSKAIRACVQAGLFSLEADQQFNGQNALSRLELEHFSQHPLLPLLPPDKKETSVTRAEFAAWLYPAAISERFLGKL